MRDKKQYSYHRNYLDLYMQGLLTGKYTLAEVSRSTGYSVPWLCRLKKRYRLQGASGLKHGNSGKIPHNKYGKDIYAKVLLLYGNKYVDINFKYFTECLEEYEGIKLSYTTVCKIMKTAGIKSPESHKVKNKKIAHRMRLRRKSTGDLLQLDGTPYAWFHKYGNEKRYCCHGAIDDASGKITSLYITENECLYGYLEIMRQTCLKYGVPREVYSDRSAIFCVTPSEKKKLDKIEQLAYMHDERTQWQRILNDLSIRQILAWTPQAKGRVERMWHTIQDRLPMWLFLHGASTVEEANRLLPEFVKEFNYKFSVKSQSDNDYWLPVPDNLNDILQCRIQRKTDHSGVFSFHAYKFQLDYEYASYKSFTLCISERGIMGQVDGKYYPVHIIDDYIHAGDMPQVLEDIIYKYMFAYAKEYSA